MGKFSGEKFCRVYAFRAFGKDKFGELIGQPIIVSTKLDGFSLVYHQRFSKFAKLFPCQTFPAKKLSKILVDHTVSYISLIQHFMYTSYHIKKQLKYVDN